MNKDQLNLLDILEEIKIAKTPYRNELGELLPWEVDEVRIYKAKIKRKK